MRTLKVLRLAVGILALTGSAQIVQADTFYLDPKCTSGSCATPIKDAESYLRIDPRWSTRCTECATDEWGNNFLRCCTYDSVTKQTTCREISCRPEGSPDPDSLPLLQNIEIQLIPRK